MVPTTILLGLMASIVSADIQVIWQHAKASGQTALSVYNSSTLIAQSCSSFIDGSHNIDFSDVDENGFGNFTVGTKHYLVHSKSEYSGGPVCIKKYNPDATVVECSGLDWKSSTKAKIETNCHEKDGAKNALDLLNAKSSLSMDLTSSPMTKREANSENAFCTVAQATILVGDGNPHQNYYYKQLSEVISCGNAQSCSVGNTQSRSYTIGWSASLSAFGWTSGGFEVSETWETGNTYTCNGGPGENICVWYTTAHTAYTVTNRERDTCVLGSRWQNVGNPFVMFSPNQANRGGGYYCVVGTCRSQGDGYWVKDGRPGGP
ncbi:hypothetical protein FLONG3_6546 [Fusarium longipes]|uniref:Uncharacterized protein n=1 Tax=Fusarium longipes TaxID=694270 RepID=A0A395SKG0_9HYPO|nr:hypothetical protein FLONG3_6546 [Fusarium longipes]